VAATVGPKEGSPTGGPPRADASSRISRNTAVNIAGSVASVLLAVLTLPVYLDAIGSARYGVLSIVWVLVGYFGVFGSGLGRSVAHYVARRRSSPREMESVVWTALAVNGALGAAGGLLLLAIAGFLFTRLVTVPAGLSTEIVASVPWLAMSIPVVAIASVLSGALEGEERFVSVNVFGVTTAVLIQIAPVTVAVAWSNELPVLIAAVVLARASIAALTLVACVRLLPLRSRPRIELDLVRPLVRFGGWITGSFLVIPFLVTLDQLVIGALWGVVAVAPYAIAFNLVTQLLIIPTSLSRTLFPRFSMLDRDGIRAVAERANLGQAIILAPLVVAGIVFLDPVMRAWIGPELGGPASVVGRILLVGIWFNSLAFIPFAWLQGEGRPEVSAKIHVGQLPPYAVVVWLATSTAGLIGAAWAWVARAVIDAAMLCAAVGASRRYYVDVAVPTALILVATTGSFLLGPGSVQGLALGLACELLVLVWASRASPQALRDALDRSTRLLPGRTPGRDDVGGGP
jgi:O-antigen/teichoic acid export membrane protein